MELFGFRLLVKDFAASLHFWRDVIKLDLQFQDETLGYAYFEANKTGFELMRSDDFAAALAETTPAPASHGRQVVIDFRVEDVDAAYAELLAQGATPVSEPRNRPAWRARTAHIADPDGYIIEIYTSLQV